MMIQGYHITIQGRVLKTARLENEWLDCITDPGTFVQGLARAKTGADCFTFRQKVGETEPKHSYPMEWEYLSAIPIVSYERWFNSQINSGARRAVKKAEKKGVEVRLVRPDEDFVLGITKIINETPIRQGRPYIHYGKSSEVVRAELSRDAERCDFLGAYLNGELIGFIQLGHGDGYVVPFGMVSLIRHRDKSPQNALLAKAVNVCVEKGIRYILYGNWSSGGLGEFKQNNGCVEMRVPRYYLPLTMLGKVACRLKLHKGVSWIVPAKIVEHAAGVRKRWYAMRLGRSEISGQ